MSALYMLAREVSTIGAGIWATGIVFSYGAQCVHWLNGTDTVPVVNTFTQNHTSINISTSFDSATYITTELTVAPTALPTSKVASPLHVQTFHEKVLEHVDQIMTDAVEPLRDPSKISHHLNDTLVVDSARKISGTMISAFTETLDNINTQAPLVFAIIRNTFVYNLQQSVQRLKEMSSTISTTTYTQVIDILHASLSIFLNRLSLLATTSGPVIVSLFKVTCSTLRYISRPLFAFLRCISLPFTWFVTRILLPLLTWYIFDIIMPPPRAVIVFISGIISYLWTWLSKIWDIYTSSDGFIFWVIVIAFIILIIFLFFFEAQAGGNVDDDNDEDDNNNNEDKDKKNNNKNDNDDNENHGNEDDDNDEGGNGAGTKVSPTGKKTHSAATPTDTTTSAHDTNNLPVLTDTERHQLRVEAEGEAAREHNGSEGSSSTNAPVANARRAPVRHWTGNHVPRPRSPVRASHQARTYDGLPEPLSLARSEARAARSQREATQRIMEQEEAHRQWDLEIRRQIEARQLERMEHSKRVEEKTQAAHARVREMAINSLKDSVEILPSEETSPPLAVEQVEPSQLESPTWTESQATLSAQPDQLVVQEQEEAQGSCTAMEPQTMMPVQHEDQAAQNKAETLGSGEDTFPGGGDGIASGSSAATGSATSAIPEIRVSEDTPPTNTNATKAVVIGKTGLRAIGEALRKSRRNARGQDRVPKKAPARASKSKKPTSPRSVEPYDPMNPGLPMLMESTATVLEPPVSDTTGNQPDDMDLEQDHPESTMTADARRRYEDDLELTTSQLAGLAIEDPSESTTLQPDDVVMDEALLEPQTDSVQTTGTETDVVMDEALPETATTTTAATTTWQLASLHTTGAQPDLTMEESLLQSASTTLQPEQTLTTGAQSEQMVVVDEAPAQNHLPGQISLPQEDATAKKEKEAKAKAQKEEEEASHQKALAEARRGKAPVGQGKKEEEAKAQREQEAKARARQEFAKAKAQREEAKAKAQKEEEAKARAQKEEAKARAQKEEEAAKAKAKAQKEKEEEEAHQKALAEARRGKAPAKEATKKEQEQTEQATRQTQLLEIGDEITWNDLYATDDEEEVEPIVKHPSNPASGSPSTSTSKPKPKPERKLLHPKSRKLATPSKSPLTPKTPITPADEETPEEMMARKAREEAETIADALEATRKMDEAAAANRAAFEAGTENGDAESDISSLKEEVLNSVEFSGELLMENERLRNEAGSGGGDEEPTETEEEKEERLVREFHEQWDFE